MSMSNTKAVLIRIHAMSPASSALPEAGTAADVIDKAANLESPPFYCAAS